MKLSSANAFKLDKAKILSIGKGFIKLEEFPRMTDPSPIAQSEAVREEIKNRRSLVRSPALPIFFPRTDDSHCDRIHSSLTDVWLCGKAAGGLVKRTPGKDG